MTFIPPEPHKFYTKKNYGGTHYIMLIEYDHKYNWWTVEHLIFGKRCSYKEDFESLKKDDGWEPIPEREYWEAMDRFGRLLSGKAAANIVESEKPKDQPEPEPEVTGFRKWVCDLLGIKGSPKEEVPAEKGNED